MMEKLRAGDETEPAGKIGSLVTSLLRASVSDYSLLYSLCNELSAELCLLSGFDPEAEENRNHLELAAGRAIGPTWAAMCINDIMRTKKFFDGLYLAVSEKLDSIGADPLHVVYAGTGPFATLALPLLYSFSSEQVQFTLLEVNERSYKNVIKTIRGLKADHYMRRILQTDAAEYILPAEKVDLLICETLQQALKNEPQVSIMLNLVPQLSPDAILVPQEIRLDAVLVDTRRRQRVKQGFAEEKYMEVLKEILVLNKDTTSTFHRAGLPRTGIFASQELVKEFPELDIYTSLVIYRNIELLLDESPLTLPLKIKEVRITANLEGRFEYQFTPQPTMRFVETGH